MSCKFSINCNKIAPKTLLYYAYGMTYKDMIQYIGVSVIAFTLAALIVSKVGEYFQMQYAAVPENTLSISGVVYAETADEDSALADTMQIQTDMYAKHLLAVNDPSRGCGCPECCAAI